MKRILLIVATLLILCSSAFATSFQQPLQTQSVGLVDSVLITLGLEEAPQPTPYFESGETITTDHKAVLNTSWTVIQAEPAVAMSTPKIMNFTQKLTVCNNAVDEGYLFLDYWFNEPLRSSSLKRVLNWNETVPLNSVITECHTVGTFPDNQTVCSSQDNWVNQTYARTTITDLGTNIVPQNWGGVYHYVNQRGEDFQPGECKDYSFNYKPSQFEQNGGKWNLNVWGSAVDDWSCIQDNTCAFNDVLDPTFSTNYTYKRNIQFNITTAYPATNNYTATIIVNSTTFDMSVFTANMNDVLFTNFDESQQLGCYKESGTSATFGNFSCLITNFSNATNTSIWMYYDNPSMTTNDNNAEINNAYLLADDMNTSSINSTIWNELVGTQWGVAAGGAYNSSSTTADVCEFRGTGTANQKCMLVANTTGVFKQTQRYQVDVTYVDNMTQPTACGPTVGFSDNASTKNIGNNLSYYTEDDMLTRMIIKNGTNINSATPKSERRTGIVNAVFRNTMNNDVLALYDWYNNSISTLDVNFNTDAPNASASPNSFMNDTNKFYLFHTDGSGAVQPCESNSGILWYGVRVHAYINASVSQVNGSQQTVTQPPIALNIVNDTWEPNVWETGRANFTIDVKMDGNTYNNITNVNFSYNGHIFKDSQITNVTVGINETIWNITIRPDLVVNNNTLNNLNWSFMEKGNGTNANVSYSTNRTQQELWDYWVNNETWVSPVGQNIATLFNFNLTKMVDEVGMTTLGNQSNITLEYNGSNLTPNATMTQFATTFEIYSKTFTTPSVGATSQTVNWTAWLNLTYNGVSVARRNSSNTAFTNGTQNISNSTAIALTVSNETWETTGLYDTGGVSNYSINVTFDGNFYDKIFGVNFSINGFTYRDSQIDNTTVAGSNWTKFNISVYTPMVVTNGSNIGFNWSFYEKGNSTNVSMGNSSNRTQPVNWGWYPNNFTYVSPLISGRPDNILVNFTKAVKTPVAISYNVSVEYNGTNHTNANMITNATGYEEWNGTFKAPYVYISTLVSMKGWLNISFNGSFVTRDPSATQELTPLLINATTNWQTPVYETGLANFSVNITWNGNDINYVLANFTYDFINANNTYATTSIANVSGTSGIDNINWTQFSISLRPNLTNSNNSNYSFQWNLTLITNGTNLTNATNVTNQSILFAYYPSNWTWTTPIPELTSNNFNLFEVNEVCEVGLPVLGSFGPATIEYAGANKSAVNPVIFVGCPTQIQFSALSMTSPSVSTNTVEPFLPWFNVSFGGLTKFRNGSNQTQLVEDNGGIQNETYTTPIFETSLANFTLTVMNISPLTIQNVNFTWNATQFNGTNITNVSSGNLTVFNVSLYVPLAPANQTNYTFQWNYTTNAPENKSTNLTNQTVFWSYYPNKLDLEPQLFELFPQNVGLNITKMIFQQGTSYNATVEWNQTNQTTVLTNNQTNWEDWNATFITPSVSADVNVQAKGWLNITFQGNNYLRNTSNSSQTIFNLNFSCGKCKNSTTNFTAVLNFSFFDEFGNQSILENGSDSITLWTTLQSVNQTFGCNFNNVSFHELCVQNVNTNFTANYNVQYGGNVSVSNGTTYDIREFWKRNQSISNTTQNFSLYNLLAANATEITLTAQDSARNPLQNVIVEAWKFNISNNSYMQVDSGVTDFDGNVRLRLYKADDYYQFISRDGGGQIIQATSQFKLLFTQYFLNINPANQINILTVLQAHQISHNLTFDNGTKTFSLQYIDQANLSDNYCLEIVNTTGTNNTILSKQCSGNHTGSFSFVLGNGNGTYVGKMVYGSSSVLVDMIDVVLDSIVLLGKDAFFGAFILVGTVSAAGWVVSPTISLGLLGLGLTGMYMMHLLPVHWAGFVSIIAVIVFSMFAIRRGI